MQVEPSYSKGFLKHTFISNKSRYFFDGIKNSKTNNATSKIVNSIFKMLYKTLYLFELNFLKNKLMNFFYIIYENVSIDLLCLLSIFKYKYSFIKLKNLLNKKLNNNIESNFLFNLMKLDNSSFCLIINTSFKFENIGLNLKLKQRYYKGNFKLLSISSYVTLVANSNVLGTNIKLIKLINEGIHPLCQSILNEKNPSIFFNSKLLKLNINKFILFLLLNLKKYIRYINYNMLSWSIYESGINLVDNLTNSYNKILLNFSIIYLVNVLYLEHNFINYIFNVNLLYLTKKMNLLITKKAYLNQNHHFNKLHRYKKIKYTNYFFIPIKTLFEDVEVFFNTEGFLKKSSKLLTNSKVKSGWKLLRIFFNQLNKKKISVIYQKFSFLINFNMQTRFNFLKLVFLLYLSKKITSNVYITNAITSFTVNNIDYVLNCYCKIKFANFRLKFWLNDSYLNSKDNFTNNSFILIRCSQIIRLELTNFF